MFGVEFWLSCGCRMLCALAILQIDSHILSIALSWHSLSTWAWHSSSCFSVASLKRPSAAIYFLAESSFQCISFCSKAIWFSMSWMLRMVSFVFGACVVRLVILVPVSSVSIFSGWVVLSKCSSLSFCHSFLCLCCTVLLGIVACLWDLVLQVRGKCTYFFMQGDGVWLIIWWFQCQTDSPWWGLTLLAAVWGLLIQAQESEEVAWELGTPVVRPTFAPVALYYAVQSVVTARGATLIWLYLITVG